MSYIRFFVRENFSCDDVTFLIQITNVPLSKLREKQKVIGKCLFLILNTRAKLIKAPQCKFKI